MATDIPHAVLSEQIQAALDGRRLHAAAFLTFEFDPGFFELEILPAFMDISLGHVAEVRLLMLADALRKVDAIAVYYDRKALVAGAASSRLDIQRVPVAIHTGYFHPKIVLALLDDALLVVALSANLTRSGWWENVEVAHIEEVGLEKPCSFRQDLLDLITIARRSAPHVDQHPALDAIRNFVRRVPVESQRIRGSIVLPRLFFGTGDVVEFLRQTAGNRLKGCNLEILSPFFDDSETLLPINALKAAFRPRDIRVFLPRRDGNALCSKEYFERMADVADWGALPGEIMKLAKDLDRSLHAKVYRFFDPASRYEAFFVGSANLTTAGLSNGGNIESGFFVEQRSGRKPKWWLTTDVPTPSFFEPQSEDDSLPKGTGWRLSVRYRWREEQASCLWDHSTPSPAIGLLSHGVTIAALDPLPPGQWVILGTAVSQAIADSLKSGSFLIARIAGQEDSQILVEEEQMTHKPSILATVSANDILRYWALLTPEQKQEFLEEHAAEFDPADVAMWLGTTKRPLDDQSFFATFAEIYVSFGNLERAIRTALEEDRPREAVERLFGRKFDSLRRLLERMKEEPTNDAVRNYIVLLCSSQLLTRIEREMPNFFAEHRAEARELRARLMDFEGVRAAIAFDSAPQRQEFFSWFDKWFLQRAEPMEDSA